MEGYFPTFIISMKYNCWIQDKWFTTYEDTYVSDPLLRTRTFQDWKEKGNKQAEVSKVQPCEHVSPITAMELEKDYLWKDYFKRENRVHLDLPQWPCGGDELCQQPLMMPKNTPTEPQATHQTRPPKMYTFLLPLSFQTL